MANADRKARFRKEQEKTSEELKNANNFEESDRIKTVFMPTFTDQEERELRFVPAKAAFEWYMKNDEGYFEGDVLPYRKVGKHFIKGRGGIAPTPCLAFHNKEACPACEECEELRSSGDADNTEQAKDMRLQHKYTWIFNWVNAPEKFVDVPLVWEVGLKQHNQFLGLMGNTRAPEFDHPFEGASVFVKRIGAKGDSNTFYETDYEKDDSYMFVNDDGEFDYERAEAFIKKLPDIETYGDPFLNYEETKAIVYGDSLIDVLKARNDAPEEPKEEPKEEEKPSEGRSSRSRRGRR